MTAVKMPRKIKKAFKAIIIKPNDWKSHECKIVKVGKDRKTGRLKVKEYTLGFNR